MEDLIEYVGDVITNPYTWSIITHTTAAVTYWYAGMKGRERANELKLEADQERIDERRIYLESKLESSPTPWNPVNHLLQPGASEELDTLSSERDGQEEEEWDYMPEDFD